MYHPVTFASGTPQSQCDALDDLEATEHTERYFKIRAALAFLLRGSSSPDRVFKLYSLSESELHWFSEAHPREAQEWVTLYLMKILKPLTSGFFYDFCFSHLPTMLSLPIPFRLS